MQADKQTAAGVGQRRQAEVGYSTEAPHRHSREAVQGKDRAAMAEPPPVPDGVPPNVAHAAVQTSKWVAEHGPTFETTIRARNKGNELFCFLFEDASSSPAAAFYAAHLEFYRAAARAKLEGDEEIIKPAEVSQAQHSLVALITAANADIADRIGQATEDIESMRPTAAELAQGSTRVGGGAPAVAGAEPSQTDTKAWAVRKELEMQENILQ